MRNNRSEVWCGLSKNFYFKPISEIKDTPIKTYRSQAQAKAGCSSWDRNFEVVPVIETIEIDPSANSSHMKFKVGSKVRVKNVYSGGNFDDGDIVTIRVTGTGFLYNMVRIISGTLIEVGNGQYPPERVKTILEACNREMAGPTAPAQGLTLMGIEFFD